VTPDLGTAVAGVSSRPDEPITAMNLVELLDTGAAGSPQLRTLCAVMQSARQPMVVMWGRRQQLLYNDAYSAILVERHPAAFGRPILKVWPEIADTLGPLVQRAYAGESIHMADILLPIVRNGRPQEAHFSFSYTPIHGEHAGEVLGVFCVCAETTDAVQAQRLALELEARRTQVLDSMGEGFIVLDEAYRLIEINAEGLRLDGRPKAQLIGGTHWDLWPASIGTAIEANYRRVMTQRVAVHFEHRYVGEGHDVCLDVRAFPVTGGIAALYRDVTALADAATALQHSNDRFGAAVQAIGVMWTNDADGRMSGEQPGWAELTGQAQGEYSGFGWAAAVHPDDAQPTIDAWNEAVAEQRLFTFEHRVRRRDGAWRRFAIRAVPVIGQDGSLREWVGVHIDITDATLDAEALRAADRRKDEFLAMLAHELRNPLGPIRTTAALLARPDLPADRVAWAGGVIERQSHTMSLLLDELLDLSRFGSGLITLRPERVEVAALIEAALETVQHLFDAKSHQLTLRLPDEPVLLEVDRLRTTQVLINLLTNAAKYTGPGGHLRLEAAPTDAHMRIDVIDNGIGLAAESLNGIFDMFTQVRSTSQRSGGGLGIGLTLAKRLVEMQGGQIEVFSEGLGQGSTFSVTLPLAASP
jgi:PAS domain S-box-containing protein